MESRNYIIGAIILILLIVGAIWYSNSRDGEEERTVYEVPGEAQLVENSPQNIEFTFYGGAEGYTLLESLEDTAFADPNLVKAYTLVQTARYAETESTAGIGESIPSISVLVFEKPDIEAATGTVATTTGTSTPEAEVPEVTVEDWAASHAGFTAYGLKTGDSEQVRVDGVTGIKFASTGPFPSETYVLEHRGKYYVFLGQYEEEGDMNWNAFQRLMTEVFFL